MKKIVAAVSLATMLAGAACAADISFSYTGSNYVKSSAGNLSLDSRADCLSLEVSNDTSGVVVDFDTDEGSIVQDVYYAWMNFAIPAAVLQAKAGVWVSRDVNRVRTDAGDLEGADFELNKPGIINGSAGKDVTNLTKGKIAMQASYINSDSLPGKLTARFTLINASFNPDAASATSATESGDVEDSDITLKCGFAASAEYLQEELIRVNLAARYLEKKTVAAGLFVSPLMLPGVDLTVGGTFAYTKPYDSTNKVWSNSGTEWGVDLRARYAFTEKFSVTTMHNISSGYDSSEDDNTLVLWDMLNLTYKVNDKASVGFTANATFDNLDSDHVFTGADLVGSPYVRIDANERVAVTASIRAEASGVNPKIDGHETVDVTIPVIFAFNY